MNDNSTQVMTLAEAAKALRISYGTLRKEIRSGHLYAKRVGERRLVVPADSIAAYLRDEPAKRSDETR
jgi:excisionase family DNA binding protein